VRGLARTHKPLPPSQQLLERWHQRLAELCEIVSGSEACAGHSRDEPGGRRLAHISSEFLRADRGDRPEQLVVSLRAIKRERSQYQRLPLAANNPDRFFDGGISPWFCAFA